MNEYIYHIVNRVVNNIIINNNKGEYGLHSDCSHICQDINPRDLCIMLRARLRLNLNEHNIIIFCNQYEEHDNYKIILTIIITPK